METFSIGYNSYGTMYGTVWDYDGEGNKIGTKDITNWGVFFAVRDSWDIDDSMILISKVVLGSGSNFVITFQSADTNIKPSKYVYSCYVNPSGTSYVPGTTNLKSIGSGYFEITKGAKYGTKT